MKLIKRIVNWFKRLFAKPASGDVAAVEEWLRQQKQKPVSHEAHYSNNRKALAEIKRRCRRERNLRILAAGGIKAAHS